MGLTIKASPKAAKFEYSDGSMDVSWTLDASLTDDELADRLRRIVDFYDAQTGRPELPERIPGMALGMTRTAHPRMVDVTEAEGAALKASGVTTVANGWAPHAGAIPAPPAIPEGAEYELIPPEEQE